MMRALNHVLELADVPRPVVLLQSARDRVRNRLDRLRHGPGEPIGQMLREQGDVFAALPQRRKRDRKHVEPVVEIVPESVLTDLVGEVAIGSRDDPHVDVDGARAPEAFELPFLQDPQQLRLELNRQVPDLVEEQRSAMGQLEPPGLARMRARERAALTSEEFALDSVAGSAAQLSATNLPVAAHCGDG